MEPFGLEEIKRYSRHLVLKGMGGAGQQRLKSARVLMVGAGGLGSPVIAYLAGAGVGRLSIIDHDTISLSNLQRQVIHSTASTGQNKAENAALFARSLNTEIEVLAFPTKLTSSNAKQLIQDQDLVIDGTDTLATRRIVAQAAAAAAVPFVTGAVSMFDGQVSVIAPGGPTFADLYPEGADDADLPSCEATGILGPLTGVIGSMMAMEAVKFLTGIGDPLIGRVAVYSSKNGVMSEFAY